MVGAGILLAVAFVALLQAASQQPLPPTGDVTPVCWKLMGILGGVIGAMAIYIVKLHTSVSEVQTARVTDLKETNELADTLLGVLVRDRRKGGDAQ